VRYLSIDLGLKRIGLAYSPDGVMVTPLTAIERINREQASRAVQETVKEWSIEAIVIGVPMNGDSEAEMRRRIAHFMGLVAFEGPIFFQDEAESSIEAKERMQGAIRQKRDGRIDSIAAQIILERYLVSIPK